MMKDQDLKINGTNLEMPRMYNFDYLNYKYKSDSPNQFKPLTTWRLLLKKNFNILSSNQYVPNYMHELNSIDSILDSSSYSKTNISSEIAKLSERNLKMKIKKAIQNNEKDKEFLKKNNKQILPALSIFDLKNVQKKSITEKVSKLSIEVKPNNELNLKTKNQISKSNIKQVNKFLEKFDSTLYEKNKRILPSPQLEFEPKEIINSTEKEKINEDDKKISNSMSNFVLPLIVTVKHKNNVQSKMNKLEDIKNSSENKNNQHDRKDAWSDYFELIKNRKLKLIDENTEKYKFINNLKNKQNF